VTHTLSLYGSSGELHRALFDRTLTVSPPNSPPSLPANRRQCPRSTAASYFWAARASRGGSAAVVVAQHRIARRRAAEERATRFSSASDDKVGGFPAPIRSAAARQSKEERTPLLASPPCGDARFPTLAPRQSAKWSARHSAGAPRRSAEARLWPTGTKRPDRVPPSQQRH
jgi:hypothetical protein